MCELFNKSAKGGEIVETEGGRQCCEQPTMKRTVYKLQPHRYERPLQYDPVLRGLEERPGYYSPRVYELTQYRRSVPSSHTIAFPTGKRWQYAKPSSEPQLDFMGLFAYDVRVWISGDTTELVRW